MKDFGALPNQNAGLDITPCFTCALQFAKSHTLRAIYFSAGTYYFNTPPQSIDFQITIMGDGKGRTAFFRNYNASSPSEGLLTFVAGSSSSSVRDLGIVANNSTSGGSAISLIASSNTAASSPSPDFSLFSNLYLDVQPGEPPANWDTTVYIDGTARQAKKVNGVYTEPIGVRDVDFQNCSVFGAAKAALWLDGVVAFNFLGGTVTTGRGGSGKIAISPTYHATSGSGDSGLPSYYVNINTTFVDGIQMQASNDGHFSALFTAPITTSPFSFDNIVIGHVVGGVVGGVPGSGPPLWQKSKYIDPEAP